MGTRYQVELGNVGNQAKLHFVPPSVRSPAVSVARGGLRAEEVSPTTPQAMTPATNTSQVAVPVAKNKRARGQCDFKPVAAKCVIREATDEQAKAPGGWAREKYEETFRALAM